MKLYILRHEERFEAPTFYTELTPNGLVKSNLLKNILENENIDLIFSSPFIRVLQTIQPYCDHKQNNSVCIDYSLYETMYDTRYFKKSEYPIDLNSNDNLSYLKDPNYISTIPITDINCPETKDNVELRIVQFITKLIEKYKNTALNILIASHAATLAPLVKKESEYPLGGLTKIYENDQYLYQPINY
jgi:broad specificity phosphatase PhoE